MPNLTVQFLQHHSWPISKNNRDIVLRGDKLIQGKIFSVNTPKIMTNDSNSLGVVISSKLHNWLGKCSLDLKGNSNHITKTFVDIINEMKDLAKCKGKDLSAVIYGNHHQDWSVLNSIIDTFEAENISPTVLIGDSNLSSYLRKNILTIWGKPVDNLKLKTEANSLEVQKQVEKVLNYVEKSDNVDFSILEKLPPQTKFNS